MTPGVLNSEFLVINPRIVLASLQADLQFFVYFRSLLTVTPRSGMQRLPTHVSCMVTISGPEVHDLTLVKIDSYLPYFRPLNDPVKIFLMISQPAEVSAFRPTLVLSENVDTENLEFIDLHDETLHLCPRRSPALNLRRPLEHETDPSPTI